MSKSRDSIWGFTLSTPQKLQSVALADASLTRGRTIKNWSCTCGISCRSSILLWKMNSNLNYFPYLFANERSKWRGAWIEIPGWHKLKKLLKLLGGHTAVCGKECYLGIFKCFFGQTTYCQQRICPILDL